MLTCFKTPPVIAIAAGGDAEGEGDHTCDIQKAEGAVGGAVRCWGTNANGELGQSNQDTLGNAVGGIAWNYPLDAVKLGAGRTAVAIATGTKYTCAVLDNGQVKCWGFNGQGQIGSDMLEFSIGDGVLEDRSAAMDMGDALIPVDLGKDNNGNFTTVAIAAGFLHTCAILSDGYLKCWGHNNLGQLGQGDTETRGRPFHGGPTMGNRLPTIQLGTGRTVVAVSAGNHHTCAISDIKTLKCWGSNKEGQIGLGVEDKSGSRVPADLDVVDFGGVAPVLIETVSCGRCFTCAISSAFVLKCFGDNALGQLGIGDKADRGRGVDDMGDVLPAVAVGTGRTAIAIATGSNHACVILDNGAVKCWGSNEKQQLGFLSETDCCTSGAGACCNRGDEPGEMGDALAALDFGSGRRVVKISSRQDHTCAVLDDQSVACWGNGEPLLTLDNGIVSCPILVKDNAVKSFQVSAAGVFTPASLASLKTAKKGCLSADSARAGVVYYHESSTSAGLLDPGGCSAGCPGDSYLHQLSTFPQCSSCPANAQSDRGSTAQKQCICPLGFTGNAGQDCTLCSAGEFKNSVGGAACTACPAFSTSNPGSFAYTDCTCAPGASGPDASSCVECDAGTFKAAPGSGACLQCEDHTVSNAGSALCLCVPGYTRLDNGLCLPCAKGFYKERNGSVVCDECAANSLSDAGSTNISKCICGRGYSRQEDEAPSEECRSRSGLTVVTFTASLQTTMEAFEDLRAQYLTGVAAALLVLPKAVEIISISQAGSAVGNRRLLQESIGVVTKVQIPTETVGPVLQKLTKENLELKLLEIGLALFDVTNIQSSVITSSEGPPLALVLGLAIGLTVLVLCIIGCCVEAWRRGAFEDYERPKFPSLPVRIFGRVKQAYSCLLPNNAASEMEDGEEMIVQHRPPAGATKELVVPPHRQTSFIYAKQDPRKRDDGATPAAATGRRGSETIGSPSAFGGGGMGGARRGSAVAGNVAPAPQGDLPVFFDEGAGTAEPSSVFRPPSSPKRKGGKKKSVRLPKGDAIV